MIGHRAEGAPVAALEALHAGVPCLFSHTGGLVELSAKSGAHTFPAGDQKQLAAQIYGILDNPLLRSEMVRAHHRFAKAYTWDQLGPTHRDLITESLARFTCDVRERS